MPGLGEALEDARVEVPEVAAGEGARGDLLLELLLGGGELALLLLAALLLRELALGLVLEPAASEARRRREVCFL